LNFVLHTEDTQRMTHTSEAYSMGEWIIALHKIFEICFLLLNEY